MDFPFLGAWDIKALLDFFAFPFTIALLGGVPDEILSDLIHISFLFKNRSLRRKMGCAPSLPAFSPRLSILPEEQEDRGKNMPLSYEQVLKCCWFLTTNVSGSH